MKDALISQGYQTTDSSQIPANIWKIVKVKSGLENAMFDIQSAAYDLQNTVLKAPFRGTVCNLKSKEQNMAGSDAFCTLVDNSAFEASFQVLESELGSITTGMPVSVVPFAIDSVAQSGIVSEVNPLVDENGLVTIKARVENKYNNLYEGMNVRVVLRKAYPNRLVVPKSAVVMRTGKEVVFTLENGLSKWNYVKTGDENTTSFTILSGLKPGCKVIVSGNLNLGHDAEVEVVGAMKE
jgi:RND family efflux transporter MFP subunit